MAYSTASTHTARKAYRCDSCRDAIQPGAEYAREVVFPGHDANTGDVPWSSRVCVACLVRYGRPMPPRRLSRRSTA